MIVLLDTSAMTVYLTLTLDDGTTVNQEWQADRTLARDLLGYLRDSLAKYSASFADITAIGVFRGPGSYTGLRIGLTVMNTLAATLKVPIVGAGGKDWQAICHERIGQGESDEIVLPDYGGEAHITKPRK